MKHVGKLILVLLVIFLTVSCQTKVTVEFEPVVIALPVIPLKPDIKRIDVEGGIMYTTEDAIKLAYYLIDVQLYMATVEKIYDYNNDIEDGSN